MEFKQLTIQDFQSKLASDAHTPGGGAVAALCGNLSIALCEMLSNLTISNKKYSDKHDSFLELSSKLSILRDDLLDDMVRDSKSFDGVMKAFKLPKDTEEQKALRTKTIQEEYKVAAMVPFSIGEKIYNSISLIEYAVNNGNKFVITDGIMAMMLCKTAIFGAFLNTKVNLKSIKDPEFVTLYTDKIKAIEEDTINREQSLLNNNPL